MEAADRQRMHQSPDTPLHQQDRLRTVGLQQNQTNADVRRPQKTATYLHQLKQTGVPQPT